MKPHKWAKEIKAWADGAEIEGRLRYDDVTDVWGEWHAMPTPHWTGGEDVEYRIKPTPKEPRYLYVFSNPLGEQLLRTHNIHTKSETYIGKIKLEQDDE